MQQFYSNIINEVIRDYPRYSNLTISMDKPLTSLTIQDVWGFLNSTLLESRLKNDFEDNTNFKRLNSILGTLMLDYDQYNSLPILNLLKNPTFLQKDIMLTAFCIIDRYINNKSKTLTLNKGTKEGDYCDLEVGLEFITSKKKRLNIHIELGDTEKYIELYYKNQYAFQRCSRFKNVEGDQCLVGPNLEKLINFDKDQMENIKIYYDIINNSKNRDDKDPAAKARFVDNSNALAAFSIKKLKSEFHIPTWGYQYRIQTLIHAPNSPWGCKSDTLDDRRYSFISSQKLWGSLFTSDDQTSPVDWYLFEANSGFNLSAMLFSLTFKNSVPCISDELFELFNGYIYCFTNSPLIIGRIQALKIAVESIFDLQNPLTNKEELLFKQFVEHFNTVSEKFEDLVNDFIFKLFLLFKTEAVSDDCALQNIHSWLKTQIDLQICPNTSKSFLTQICQEEAIFYNPGEDIRSKDNKHFSKIYQMIYPLCSSLNMEKYVALYNQINLNV